jgi:transcription antitermination factor NusG
MNKKWYAVYTKPRREKKIAQQLSKKGIENYCPLNRVQRQWHDRKKIIYEPLFTSYVFIYIEERFLSEIRTVDGIINFVYWLKIPLIIRNEEIDLIKKFLNDYENVKLEKVVLNVDDKVRILSGAFMNEEGNVIYIKNK